MPIRGITLFVFGGVAEMEDEPPSAKSEFFMALAGPAASLLLSGALFAFCQLPLVSRGPEALKSVLWYLGYLNGILGLFNLIPAFPLDGGRVLRAALWFWKNDLVSATRLASSAGDLFGIVLIALGVFDIFTGNFIGGLWRILIGMFLRSAAYASYTQVIARTTLESLPVSRVMTPEPITVLPEISIADFIDDFVYRFHHRSFPVTSQGRLIGSVGTEQASEIDRGAWPTTPIKNIMLPCGSDDMVRPNADTLHALGRMQRTGKSRLWVTEDGELVGVLSLRDVMEHLSIKRELEQTRGQ